MKSSLAELVLLSLSLLKSSPTSMPRGVDFLSHLLVVL